MTMYQSLKALHEPHEDRPDEQGRCVVTFTITAVKASSSTFLLELVAVLVAATVGTYGKTILISRMVALPKDPKVSFVDLVSAGGYPPIPTQNVGAGPAYRRPSARVAAHAASYVEADALAHAAYAALVAVKNQNVVPAA